MEWLDRLNDALTYMEDHLDGDISFQRAAQLACSSVYHFQRMFSYIAGVPLSEYLRRRRMTMAAFDLQNGAKVLDVSLRYGYESPTAFNRAFQTVHGITPSMAQKNGAVLKAFPRIGFQMSIKGEMEMEYRIVKKDAFRIVGVRDPIHIAPKPEAGMDFDPAEIEESFKQVPIFWQESGQNGTITKLASLMNREPMGVLGISDCTNEGGANYYYIAVSTDRPTPEGMVEFTVPACTWAVFSGAGAPTSIQDLQKRIFSEWLPTSGYEWANAPDIEVYLDNNPTNMKYEVWLPITKKA